MANEYDIMADYKATSRRCAKIEQQLIDEYIGFLRRLALNYIGQGIKVYFFENQVVHWGEGNFGWLYIAKEEPEGLDYLESVKWGAPTSQEKGYDPSKYEITAENIDNINYFGLGFETYEGEETE